MTSYWQLFFILLAFTLSHYALSDEVELSDEDEEDDTKAADDAKAFYFTPPVCPVGNVLCLYFDSRSSVNDTMVPSQATKDGLSGANKYDGIWSVEVPEASAIEGDYGLVLKSKARHHAISRKLSNTFVFDNSSHQLVFQYEIKFQNAMDCGGAYVKLITDASDLNLEKFNDKTPYTIMFGPDKCGQDVKLHFILRHVNPVSGSVEEKHAKKPKGDLDSFFNDRRTHLYTLVVNSDNSFEIYVDQVLVSSGSLLEDLDPPINPPREIDDPDDKKPDDWDDREKIPDPAAKKPDDWDEDQPEFITDPNSAKPEGWLDHESLTIPDPAAVKPKDWDADMDGIWEAPQIDNPKCKDAPGCGKWIPAQIKNPNYRGKWSPPLIDNPSYRGVWKPKRIPNPHFFEDKEPWRISPISAIGLELWTMTDSIVFDNFLIVKSKVDADTFADSTWVVKRRAERLSDPNSQSVVDAVREATRDKPWIWAIVLLVVVLPVVLIIAYCCYSRNSPSRYAHKKDDDGDDETAEGKDRLETEQDSTEELDPPSGADAGDNPDSTSRRRVPRKD